MPCLHLRTVIGVGNAVVVAVVAAITLSVSLTVSLRTIRANGEVAIAQQGVATARAVDIVLARPKASVAQLMRLTQTATSGFSLPSQDPSSRSLTEVEADSGTFPPWGLLAESARREMLSLQTRVGFSITYFAANFLDGTSIVSVYTPSFPYATLLIAWLLPTDASSGPRGKHVALQEVPAGLPVPPGNAAADGFRNHMRDKVPMADLAQPDSLAATPTHKTKITIDLPLIVYFSQKPYFIVTMTGWIRNATHELGVASVAVTLEKLGSLLDKALISSGTAAFLVDQENHLMAASRGIEFMKVDYWVEGDPNPAGCSTTLDSAQAFPSDISGHRIACRRHVAEVGHDGLRAIITSAPDFVSSAFTNDGREANTDLTDPGDLAAESLRYLNAESSEIPPSVYLTDTHYAVAKQLPSTGMDVTGLKAVVIVVVPLADILGDADGIVALCIGITGCVVVVVAVLSLVMIWWVLRPLLSIADRMARAARFEPDDPPARHSWLREIADLQQAFDQMAAELDRVRSFVPQSLLQCASDDSEFDETVEDESSSQPRHLRVSVPGLHPKSASVSISGKLQNLKVGVSGRSIDGGMDMPTGSSFVSASSARMLQASVAGLKLVAVSYLCVNIRGFHARFAGAGGGPVEAADNLYETLAAIVQMVLAISTEQRGVVDSFHGDRFAVSFNAVRCCALHATRSAVVGVRIAAHLPRTELGLQVSAGAATGQAQVGNVGCDDLRRFNVISPAVTQAAMLERLCKLYPRSTCIVMQRVFANLRSAAELRVLDLVRLPFTRNPVLIANVERELVTTDVGGYEEWMYDVAHTNRHPGSTSANELWEKVADVNATGLSGTKPDACPPAHTVVAGLQVNSDARLEQAIFVICGQERDREKTGIGRRQLLEAASGNASLGLFYNVML